MSCSELRPNHDRTVVCYVSTWATYRQGHGKFNVEDIDPSLCTHLIYAFAGLNSSSSTIRVLDPFNDLEEEYGKGEWIYLNIVLCRLHSTREGKTMDPRSLRSPARASNSPHSTLSHNIKSIFTKLGILLCHAYPKTEIL